MSFFRKLKGRRGDASFVALPFVILLFAGMIMFQINVLGNTTKINKLEQMATMIAKDVSLTGEVDSSTDARFNDLKNNVFNLKNAEYKVTVNGREVGHTKLQLESNFEVVTSVKTELKSSLIRKTKERVYYGKAVGKVENYSKM